MGFPTPHPVQLDPFRSRLQDEDLCARCRFWGDPRKPPKGVRKGDKEKEEAGLGWVSGKGAAVGNWDSVPQGPLQDCIGFTPKWPPPRRVRKRGLYPLAQRLRAVL